MKLRHVSWLNLKEIKRDKELLVLVSLPFLYLLIFKYIPIMGLYLGFTDYSIGKDIFSSNWVGFKHFISFFESVYAWRTVKNTAILGILTLIFSFPIPIIFTLVLNELKGSAFKKIVQTASYFPYFISVVIVVSIMYNIFSIDYGIANILMEKLGGDKISFLTSSEYFRPLYVGSEIWQKFGYNSIIYLSAMAGIDNMLYEAVEIDGGNRLHKIWHVTLPCIKPTIIILFIVNFGSIFSIGFEKVLLMYTPGNYIVSDVMETYVYRKGLMSGNLSFGTAVGLVSSIVNFTFLIVMNRITKKLNDVSLW